MDRQTKSAIMKVIFFISLAVLGAMAFLENMYEIVKQSEKVVL